MRSSASFTTCCIDWVSRFGTQVIRRADDIEARFCRVVSGTATRAELRRCGGWADAGSTGSGSVGGVASLEVAIRASNHFRTPEASPSGSPQGNAHNTVPQA